MDVRYQPLVDHLRVTATGDFDAARCRAAVAEIGRECRERGLASVLIDFRGVTGPISIADRYDLALCLAEGRLEARIAVLVTPEQRTTGTFENTAVNRGARVRTTASEEQAREFLGLAGPG